MGKTYSKNQFSEILASINNEINLSKVNNNLINKGEKKDICKLDSSNLSKKFDNPELIELTIKLITMSYRDNVANIDLTKSILNNDIYLDNPKRNTQNTPYQFYYREQINLIEDFNEGKLLKFDKKQKTIVKYVINKNHHMLVDPPEKEHNKEKIISNKDQINDKSFKKFTSQQETLIPNDNITSLKIIKSNFNKDYHIEDLSIEDYLKKEANRIKLKNGNSFGIEKKNNDVSNQDDGNEFNIKKNKHLENFNIHGKNKSNKSKIVNNVNKNVENPIINKSRDKTPVNLSKRINIIIDLSRVIPPKDVNKNFSTKNQSLSQGVRINYKENTNQRECIQKHPYEIIRIKDNRKNSIIGNINSNSKQNGNSIYNK